MKSKWAIFSDVDGTIYGFPDKILPETNRQKLLEITEKGVPFILNTGNGPFEKIKKLASLTKSRYMICSNGAVIYDNVENKFVHIEYIPLQEARKIFDLADKHNIKLYYFGTDQYYLKNHTPEMYRFLSDFLEYEDWITDGRLNEDVHKIEVYGNHEEIKEAYEIFKNANIDLNIIYLGSHIEITKQGVSKGSGLKWMCENVFETSLDNVMAIGDSQNDQQMLEIVGYSYAMANSDEDTKRIAKYHTSDVLQCGLAEAIDDYLYRSDFELKRQISQQTKK
ncbi:Cof-type HAD-IIB family hydrolase [Mycoplasmopsis anatis]|uniref:COF family haloacid dehalogenase(HAD)-like hydrolase n=2 Tax=Mycoplasmopsis anatis TaxID=171279 RepID=F9QDY4_9BACT|nr:Cof-type HAD-IIB family hydrolase [Mycoplasmopsis anatis]AWX69862.1 Cof-type HAD-IIB family hydrolase [Mycoplasmopsis anatis]EGS29032.1 COF family haloacid dehalogenase(HAD)-like hydrolase [Mycoplasmopsis anatis 1340]MBW0594931.1 Cof-type HAD-IIB family hydrolase [Mycoplasmopsis anatis]MBW0595526.1 Cof-type HAD-IIB family hydrolase [Mycoplasmopsis anatis]MBW0595812.1 Cof-type HAD-IIB family hydrolase [Mycoplasmopsis anatis]